MITIGLPFYNAQATLVDAIRSVFAQTIEDWELLLVNDGSTDASAEIARAVDDPRVRVIDSMDNRKLPYRLNQIADLANGEYIARMDADDLMHPERLEREQEYLHHNPDVELVGTGLYSINATNQVVGMRWCEPREFSGRGLVLGRMLAHATVMGRREWFRENRYDPTEFRSQDHELWCRSWMRGTFHAQHMPEPLYLCREEGSITIDKMLASYRTVRRIVWRYGPDLLGWPNTVFRLGVSHLKGIGYRAFDSIGKIATLANRRNTALTEEQERVANSIVAAVLQTQVPGLE